MEKPVGLDATPVDAKANVLRQFRIVFGAVRSHFKQIEKLVGLGGAQVWALSVVQKNPGLSLGELARRLDVHQSTASNLIKVLTTKGLVQMEKDTLDKRQLHLNVTDQAVRLLAQVPGPVEGLLPHALARLPQSSLETLQEELSALIKVLKADESAAGIPLAEL